MSISSDHPAGGSGGERKPDIPRSGGSGRSSGAPSHSGESGRQSGTPPHGGGSGRQSGAPRRRRRRRNPALTAVGWIFKILGTLILIGAVTACFVACYGVIYIKDVIAPMAARLDLDSFTLNESSTIYYTDKNTGQAVELATCYGAENREILESSQIPEVFKNAAIAIEDKRFRQHQGVDWVRTAAAVLYMFTGQDIQGGSTITQQVIKNYTGRDEVTVKRKVLEIFEALAVEDRYSKDDILTRYLNYIYLGGHQYGIAAASRYYFDKEVSEITQAEAASIIAITNNPSLYSPYSTVEIRNSKTGKVTTGLERNKTRQELILHEMCYTSHMITEEEYKAAIAQPLNFVRGDTESKTDSSNVNPWIVDQAMTEVVDWFESLGYSRKAGYDMIYSGGLHIYTTYDPEVQAAVDEVYTDKENLPYISKDGQQMQSCIVIVDNSTGYVVAMAGQIGEKTGNLWWNFATDSTRQPGSSIKPLAVYSPAIDMNLITPYSIVDDAPYQLLNNKAWPRNATRRYAGLSTVLTAVTVSTNTAAVRVISDMVGVENSFRFMEERYGITTLEDHLVTRSGQVKNDYGASQLALGGLTSGLRAYEVAAAYATFPRGGAYTKPTVVLRVENRDHQVIWDNTPKTTYPIKESTAYYMNVMLQNVVNASNGTGRAARFDGMPIAGKTGTTTDAYDLWFAGYTPYYTAVVWTGYERNSKIDISPSPAVVLWRQVMSKVHEELESKPFFTVSNLSSYTVCLDCGQLATDACTNDIRGPRTATCSFVKDTQPSGYCTCHVPITVCLDSPILGEDGEPTGLYHKAGEFCPEESVRTVCIVDHRRDAEVCAGVKIADQSYMVSYYERLEEQELAMCDVHTEAPPDPNDPDDPDNPDAPDNPDDPNDPDIPDNPVGPDTPDNPSGPDIPWDPNDPPVTPAPSTEPTPEPTPEFPPDNPFVPAG